MTKREREKILEHAAKFKFDEFKIYTGTRKVKFVKDGVATRLSTKKFFEMQPPKKRKSSKKAAAPATKPVVEYEPQEFDNELYD